MFVHAHEQGRKNKAPLLMLLLLRESEREDEERGEGGMESERASGDESKKQRHRGERGLEEKG